MADEDNDEDIGIPRELDELIHVLLRSGPGLSPLASPDPPSFSGDTATTTTASIRGSDSGDTSCLSSDTAPPAVALFAEYSDADIHRSARKYSWLDPPGVT